MAALNKLRDRNFADSIPGYVKPVNGSYTGTTAGTVYAFGATERARIKGWDLTVFVGVVLGGNATAGDYIIMYDAVVTAPIAVLGIIPAATLAPGSIFGTSAVGGTTFTTAATVWSTGGDLPMSKQKQIPLGYTTTAAGNDILFALVGGDDGAVEDASTGIIRVVGTISYDLV